MSDEETLRMKAREAMEAGRLSQRRPKRMWGGPGIGAPCAVCSEPVKKDELGFELEYALDQVDTGEGDCHVHLRCFAAWEFERRNHENGTRAEAANDSAVPAVLAGSDRQVETILPDASNEGRICASNEVSVSAGERDKTYQRGSVR
jgi:hypothetical protein